MVVGGVSTPRQDRAEAIAEMALDTIEEIDRYRLSFPAPLPPPPVRTIIFNKKTIFLIKISNGQGSSVKCFLRTAQHYQLAAGGHSIDQRQSRASRTQRQVPL